MLIVAAVVAAAAGATTPSKTKMVGSPKLGKTIFKQQGCGSCHMLAAAGSTDASGLGPDLDTSKKTYTQLINQITKGGGSMSAYGKILTAAQIQDLAVFIYDAAHAP